MVAYDDIAVKLTCAFCGVDFDKKDYLYRFALKAGQKNFHCSNACVGKAKKRAVHEKRADTLAYFRRYHQENIERRHAQAHERHVKNYDPEKRRQEYLRPGVAERESRQSKERYAKQNYGELWQSFVLINTIRTELSKTSTREQVRAEKGYFERKHERKKSYERPDSKEPKECPLGNLERRERR